MQVDAQAQEGAPRIEGAQGVALPTWEEARDTRVATMRHIPTAASHEWARTAAPTFQACCDSPEDEEPWIKLYILTRCILVARPGDSRRQIGSSACEGCLLSVEEQGGGPPLEGGHWRSQAPEEGKLQEGPGPAHSPGEQRAMCQDFG